MASGWTNRGRLRELEMAFRNEYNGSTPAASPFYVALITSASTPDADTNLFSELTEITAGNGYVTGGTNIARSAVGFDVLTEDDGNDLAFIQLLNVQFTASGGTIPASGGAARYSILTDDNATIASREVLAFWDLTSGRSIGNGANLNLNDLELAAA